VRRYLWRRALRILPAYWLAVAGYLLVLPQQSKASTLTWIDHLALTQIYGVGRFADGFAHTWSLCTEVAFYLVLPAVAGIVLIGRWRPGQMMLSLAALGITITGTWIALMAAGLIGDSPHRQWLPSYAVWFAAGMALAVAKVALETSTETRRFRTLEELASAPLACWLIAFAALAIATTPLAGPRDLRPVGAAEFAVKLVLYAIVAVMLLLPLAFGPANRVNGAFSSAPARWIGLVSYGLFLWHPLVIALIYQPGARPVFTGDFGSTFAIVLGAGLLLATLSYYVVERPVQLVATLGDPRRKGPPGQGKPEKADRAKALRLGEPVDGTLLSAPRGEPG
jgi:peptidoglycan/LPS O-acetylase OafA/YrhL